MKTLVVYYSRTGVTRKVAEELAEQLGADLEEIHERKSRRGVLGFLGGAWDALRKKSSSIEPARCDPADYDLVLIGTPVWAGTMATPARSYLTERGRAIRRAALFCTHGGGGAGKAFRHMEELCGRSPTATMSLRGKAVQQDQHGDEVKAFVDSLKGDPE